MSTITPVITAPTVTDGNGNTRKVGEAPIASASRTTRIKVWSLYLTILNAIVELGAEDGKAAFGTQEWRSLVSKVRDGGVWEEVVKNGYRGVEGDVDADVVINLATLLLAHAPHQRLNQTRLEAYLAASLHPNLDIASRLAQSNGTPRRRANSASRSAGGTDTPRDLNARVKILELYTLHVLLRNDEWDYAREFISNSEVLDEERKDAFLNALQSLEDEREEQAQREIELERRREEELKRDLEEAKRQREENEERERLRLEEQRSQRARSERASSENDFGVDTSSAPKAKTKTPRPKKTKKPAGPLSAKQPQPTAVVQKTMFQKAGVLLKNLGTLLTHLGHHFRNNPLYLMRTLAFIVILLLALSNKVVKDRVRRMMNKVRATAGMGVKVSYI